jgi:outer membrane lipoprotein SlyB
MSGCNTYGNFHPTVDSYGDKNAYRLNQDMAECDQIARQASGGFGKETAVGVGVGGLGGAVVGTVAGAFLKEF